MLGRAGQRLVHEVGPGGYRHTSPLFAVAQRAILIEPGPHGRDEIAVEAIEPSVVMIIGRARLAADIVAIERAGAHSRAVADDVLHHVGQ